MPHSNSPWLPSSDGLPVPPAPCVPAAAAEGESVVRALLARFSAVEDPRLAGCVAHRLPDVLFCALCAVMSNCGSFTAMETFTQTQLAWLRLHVPLPHGAPSHDTFRNVFMMLGPEVLRDIVTSWVGDLDGVHVRIDGKVHRGVKDPQSGRSRLLLLRAWVSELGLSVGQVACGEKSNELATLPALLASLQLKGAVVSIDAMAGHPEVAQLLDEAGADWMLALKGNEKETHELVASHFKTLSGQRESAAEGLDTASLQPPEVVPVQWATECDVFSTAERNRGRWEERQVVAVPVGDWLPKAFLWYGLRSAVCVLRRTVHARQSTENPTWEVHYYLTSLPPQAAKLGACIRGHWAVENSCHHLLDVTFGEDHCQVRDRTAAQNLTVLREISASLLKAHPRKGSIKSKRERAALCPDFRSEVLARAESRFHA